MATAAQELWLSLGSPKAETWTLLWNAPREPTKGTLSGRIHSGDHLRGPSQGTDPFRGHFEEPLIGPNLSWHPTSQGHTFSADPTSYGTQALRGLKPSGDPAS